ncbi:MAG TPA: hypothetical protein V6C65_04105 [Allocoleopsis sp.]
MAKHITTTCDRCGKLVTYSDDRIEAEIQKDFPGNDFCQSCAEQIYLAGEIAKQAAAQNKSPKEILQAWLDRYK